MLQRSIMCSMGSGEHMSTTQRVHKDPGVPEAPGKIDYNESFARLFVSGITRIAEMQKKTLEIAAQQNAEIVDVWKKAVQKLPGSPGLFMLELENSGFDRYAEVQKVAIDLVVEQGRAFADLLKDRAGTAAKVGEGAGTFAKESVERVVAMQKKALEQTAAQAKAVVETSSRQFAVEGTPVETAADSIQRGVDAIIDAQKELLDLAVR